MLPVAASTMEAISAAAGCVAAVAGVAQLAASAPYKKTRSGICALQGAGSISRPDGDCKPSVNAAVNGLAARFERWPAVASVAVSASAYVDAQR